MVEFRFGAGMGGLRGGIVAEEREEGRAAAADHDAERVLREQEIAEDDQQGEFVKKVKNLYT